MKLLLVEDNRVLAQKLIGHVPAPYSVDTVETGAEALQRIDYAEYRVIILDLGLPDMPGLEVCKRIRQTGSKVPILVLTGEDDMPMRVSLLESGADDYMTKPFDTRELRARIAALCRRQPLVEMEECIIIGDLVIDSHARTVARGGVPILLRRKEFDILHYLVSNRGKIVTREMIVSNVWNSSANSWANTVDVHIKNLRDKVDRPFNVPLIKTAYGIGYRVDVPEGVIVERSTP